MPQEYAFRYELDLNAKKQQVYHDRPTELIRAIVADLLNLVVLLEGDKEIKVNGFRWLMDRERVYEVFPKISDSSYPVACADGRESHGIGMAGKTTLNHSLSSEAFYEPRIDFIKRLIEHISDIIEFEQDSREVKVDGFRLKSLQDWLVRSAGDPREVFEYLGSRCNCDCVFCCNKGNDHNLPFCNHSSRTADEEFEEAITRIKYFSAEAGRALFPRLGPVFEVTAHPRFMETLHLLRERTNRPFRITTNGRNITPDVVAELNKLRPVYLCLSLQSSSPSRRQSLMRDPEPEIAINALSLLREARVPYSVVIVPWPTDGTEEMLDDLSATTAYAVQQGAYLIQVNLPGYSKYFSCTEPFNLDETWKAIISRVRELREIYDCPIVTMPAIYEENIYEPIKNLPRVIGLGQNSPAHIGGLKRGDVILRINGVLVRNRPQARDLLSILQQSEAKSAILLVQRSGQAFEVSLDLSRYSYPYSSEFGTHLGIIFMGTGLRIGYVERLKEIIRAHAAQHVLLLSSKLVKPTLEQCLAESHLNSQFKIDIEIPENRFFGGNIVMGDLLVVEDFIDCIKQYVINHACKPDLIVIPSSPFNLSGWGRDLTGRVYLDIERQVGIQVELLDCATVFD